MECVFFFPFNKSLPILWPLFLILDLNVHNLENAAILWSCQSNHLFLVDPHCYGQQQFERQNKQNNKTNIDKLDLKNQR